MTRLAALALVASLAGCASKSPPAVVHIPPTPLAKRIPADLLRQEPEPVPGDITMQSGVARYCVAAVEWGRRGWINVEAIAGIVEDDALGNQKEN